MPLLRSWERRFWFQSGVLRCVQAFTASMSINASFHIQKKMQKSIEFRHWYLNLMGSIKVFGDGFWWSQDMVNVDLKQIWSADFLVCPLTCLYANHRQTSCDHCHNKPIWHWSHLTPFNPSPFCGNIQADCKYRSPFHLHETQMGLFLPKKKE